jgi:hypothetical protein
MPMQTPTFFSPRGFRNNSITGYTLLEVDDNRVFRVNLEDLRRKFGGFAGSGLLQHSLHSSQGARLVISDDRRGT